MTIPSYDPTCTTWDAWLSTSLSILVIARLFNMLMFWHLWKCFLLPLALLDLQTGEFGYIFNRRTHFSGDLEFKEQHPFFLHSSRAAEDRYQRSYNESFAFKQSLCENEMQARSEQGAGCACRGQRSPSGIFLNCPPPRQGFLQNLKLTNSLDW